MRRLRSLLSMLVAAATLGSAQAEERIAFPSFDGGGRAPLVLTGYWFPAASSPAPAVVLFHGCNGAYDRQGRLDRRMVDYTEWFNARGFGALVVDSLTPRGEKEICTQRIGKRRLTQANRRLDALAAIAYLAQRQDVDPKRIGLVGWSHGGSTVLAATNRRHADVAAARTQPAFAVAFYPGCGADLQRGYDAATPLLILIGEADDWTPAAPCHRLAEEAVGIKPEIEGYAGAFHGFDSSAPLLLRKDVPNGVHPGQGVHVGGDAQALRRSRERLADYLASH